MASYNRDKHNIGLLRQAPLATTSVGFMLAQSRDKSGNLTPRYRRYDDEPLAEQRAMGAPSYGWFPPGKELPIILDDFSGGLSREIYDSRNPTKYFKAINMDCRFGNAIAGLKAETLTKPTSTAPTILNQDFELFTGDTPNNWTVESGTTFDEEGTVHGDSHACKLLDAGADTVIYQDLATTQIQGRRFTVTAYLHAGAASKGKFGVNNGTTTTWSDWHTGGGDWEQLSVIITLTTSATKLRLYVHGEQASGVYVDDVAITRATLGTTTCHATYGGHEYINFGGLLAKIQSSDGTILGVWECPSPITGMAVHGDGLLYLALGDGTVIEDCEDAWTQGTADTTVTLDTSDYKVGSGSAKLDYNGLGANGVILGYEDFTVIDITDYQGVAFWIKVSSTVAASDLAFCIDDTSACANPLEAIVLPALTANEWTEVYLEISDPSDMTAVISVGLEYNANEKTNVIHLDDIRVIHKYRYIGTGGDGITSTISDGFAKRFELNGTTLWKQLDPNELKSATNPANGGSWSTATTVASSDKNITALESLDNTLYAIKADKPFYLTAGGTVEPLTDATTAISTSTSGKNSTTWHDDLFMPWGTGSLLRYHNGVPEWIDPALYCRNLGDFDGIIQGFAGDDQWGYAIVDNDTKVEILAGREEVSGWIWHGSLCEITLTGCEIAFVSSVFKKRLYISSTDSTESLYYVNLYANYGDVTNDANRNFPDGGELHTPWLHGNFKGDTKAYIKITLTMEDTSSTVYFEGHYRKLGQSWAQGADIGDFKTSPTTVKYIPVDAGSLKPKSTMMQFKFVEKTGSATSTPKLINVDIRAILYVNKRRIIECVVRGCDAPLNRQKMSDAISASHISTVLIEADNATWPVTFYPWGWQSSSDTVYVNFLSADEVVEIDEESRKPEVHWYLRLLEVNLGS